MAVPASAAKADMYAASIGLSRCGISCRLYDELIGAPTLTQTVQIKDSVSVSRVDDAPWRADPSPACADVEPAGRSSAAICRGGTSDRGKPGVQNTNLPKNVR